MQGTGDVADLSREGDVEPSLGFNSLIEKTDVTKQL